jgi:hypothetical protein
MPGRDLPVVVAARLSLSFPMLLSTIPLWSKHPSLPHLVQHCMSDGGICSNFPIHFFDALFPARPTFGLDLQPYPTRSHEQELDQARVPYVLFGDVPRPPAFSSVDTVFTFFRQLGTAFLEWRDNMQAELPGYRDRICQIRLTNEEGGLNLDMPQPVVDALVRRGEEAGEAIVGSGAFVWNRHRYVRYRTLMDALETGLGGVGPRFENFVRCVNGEIPPEWPYHVDAQPPWWDTAHPLTTRFLATVTWGREGVLDFSKDAPVPRPSLRITPSV